RMGEVFVTNAGSNNVTVISDVTNAVVASIPVGSSPLGATYDVVDGYTYVSNLFQGTISIISPGGAAPPPPTYLVSLTETGLPTGTSWSVTLGGTARTSTTSTIIFSEADGTYSYAVGPVTGYAASPASGTITVNGAAVSQSIAFTQVTYSVTFTETGLPSGTSWSVTLAGTTKSSTGSSITFSDANGAYPYSVDAVTGSTASPPSGSITVSRYDCTQP